MGTHTQAKEATRGARDSLQLVEDFLDEEMNAYLRTGGHIPMHTQADERRAEEARTSTAQIEAYLDSEEERIRSAYATEGVCGKQSKKNLEKPIDGKALDINDVTSDLTFVEENDVEIEDLNSRRLFGYNLNTCDDIRTLKEFCKGNNLNLPYEFQDYGNEERLERITWLKDSQGKIIGVLDVVTSKDTSEVGAKVERFEQNFVPNVVAFGNLVPFESQEATLLRMHGKKKLKAIHSEWLYFLRAQKEAQVEWLKEQSI